MISKDSGPGPLMIISCLEEIGTGYRPTYRHIVDRLQYTTSTLLQLVAHDSATLLKVGWIKVGFGFAC